LIENHGLFTVYTTTMTTLLLLLLLLMMMMMMMTEYGRIFIPFQSVWFILIVEDRTKPRAVLRYVTQSDE